MSKTAKFFRWVWRVDAILILVAAGAIAFGVATLLVTELRADLVVHRPSAGFGSGGYSETRNILFITPGEVAARWLLPDHDHVITETEDVVQHEEQPKANRTVATAVLVKKRGPTPEAGGGRLLLFDPSGRSIVEVADGVRTMHAATLSGGEVAVLFERDRRLSLAMFDPQSLAKHHEQQMDVPQLE